jgi:hypothetical protein
MSKSNAVLSLLLLSAACEMPEAGQQGASRSEILSSATVTPENTAVVQVTVGTGFNGMCTGYLLTNSWALTARHCVLSVTASQLVVRMGSSSSFVDQIVEYPSSNPDVALLKLRTALPMWGSTSGHRVRWSQSWAGQLINEELFCWGYGAHDNSGTIDGLLRFTAGQIVTGVESGVDVLLLPPNQWGERNAPGDSGGPCFRFNGELAGTIMGNGERGGVDVDLVTSTDNVRGWADPIINANP